MSGAFANAWILLKNRAQEEERSYGDVSYREHPLYGQEGFRGSEEESGSDDFDEEQNNTDIDEKERTGVAEKPRLLSARPPTNIGQAGSSGGAPPREGNPFQQAMGSLQQRGKPSL